MNGKADRLFELLPAIYRLRDADQGWPLRALLQVIAEQVNVVEADIDQLYQNWFIETCQDWVVPYIGDLIGYEPVHEAGEPSEVSTPQGLQRNKILIPRREVANTIRYRRRKGTLALLEVLANAVAGWPARAVEFYRLLGVAQAINHLHLDRGRTADLRNGDALERLDGPFDELAHSVDVRRINSHRTVGRYNIPSVGVFVWRLKAYSVTQAPAYCFEEEGPHCYLFSVLGNDTQLFTPADPEAEPGHAPWELNLPTPIRRRAFELHTGDYYGEGKSMQIWVGVSSEKSTAVEREPIPLKQIVPADLSDWKYRPLSAEQVAVDPELARRMLRPARQQKRMGVWVSYYYGFSADVGGGEYDRPLSQPSDYNLYRVGEQQTFTRINDALDQWTKDQPQNAVIEITDSRAYVEQINISLKEKQTLQLRAASRKRPVIRLLDWRTSSPDNLSVTGEAGSWFTLDGLLVAGRGVQVQGDMAGVTIRHSTLVPGWGLHCDCEPHRPAEPSLELFNSPACITIEHSIVGSIQVVRDEVKKDPGLIRVSDSVVDATSPERVALGAPEGLCAYAILTIARSTVFGQIETHAIDLGENSIFMGRIGVGRRQQGCIRFCYVTPGSRTPRRYECQPDLVEKAVRDLFDKRDLTPEKAEERDALLESERLRVEAEFNSTRYGRPAYCQLAEGCADEIKRGADDESEMGVFHDLYQPQRAANLRARLDEYTPAGMDAGIIYAS
jgi:hypothetical protein